MDKRTVSFYRNGALMRDPAGHYQGTVASDNFPSRHKDCDTEAGTGTCGDAAFRYLRGCCTSHLLTCTCFHTTSDAVFLNFGSAELFPDGLFPIIVLGYGRVHVDTTHRARA